MKMTIMNNAAPLNFKKELKKILFFFKFLPVYWKTELWILVLLEVSVGLSFINPYITKLIIDVAYKNRDIKLFIILAILGGAVFLVNGAVSNIKNYYSSKIRKRISVDINSRVAAHLYSLNLGFFKDTSSGENLYKVTYDIEHLSYLLTNTFEQILKLAPTFIFTIIIVSYLNWQMGLMAFLMGVFLYAGAFVFAGKRRVIQEQVIKKDQGVFKILNEGLLNISFLKASGRDVFEAKRYVDKLEGAMSAYFEGEKLSGVSNFVSGAVNKIVIGLIAFYGGYQIIRGNMTLGTLSAIMLYLSRITDFHFSLANIYQSVVIGAISSERVLFILNAAPEDTRLTPKIIPPKFCPEIIFDKVSFGYYPDRLVLKNFNMRIRPQEWTALVGKSGCGKSTIISLALGLYYPTGGNIFIDGVSTQRIDLNFVRRSSGVALQDTFLWNASIKENILYFEDNAAAAKDLERVIEEVRLSGLISGLAQGMDTPLGDEACRLSTGQKQRLSLARALIQRPKFLIMDEALSSVDNITAMDILRAIKENYRETTVLMVTHYEGALKYTDKVIYIRDADCAVEDRHKNLLKVADYNNIIQVAE